MKLIIDIPNYDLDNVQVGSIASKIIFKAVKNGIPLDDIRAEIEEQKIIIHSKAFESEYKSPMLNGQLSGISIALDIIDKHIGESEEE